MNIGETIRENKDARPGVSVEFFCKALNALVRIHGNRGAGEPVERMRAALQEAESAYLECPPIEKKRRTKETKGNP